MSTQLVILQATAYCNLDCSYCYLPHRSSLRRIRLETLNRIYQALFSSDLVSDSLTIVWHAGEPLVMSADFYEQAFQAMQPWNRQGVSVTHSIQTNAVRITQRWCDLFRKYHVQVGVSLDGPEFLHDAHRVDKGGNGTFQRVMRGIRLLQENDIPFTVIAVVTQETLKHAEAFWRFFMQLRPARLGLNPEEIQGIHTHSSLDGDEYVHAYYSFMRTLLDLRDHTPQPIVIREVESMERRILQYTSPVRTQTNVSGVIMSFDCDGNISTFSPEMLTMSDVSYGDFLFGNVFEHTLEEALSGSKFLQVNEDIQFGVQKCQETCRYFFLCGGGFPANKMSEHGSFRATETLACRLRVKATADAIIGHLEERYHLAPSE